MFSKFFIDRPIFATVIALLMVLGGLLTVKTLPVAQYPDITPPTVFVMASYPGADAKTVAEVIGVPLEQQVNGVEGMMYMSSSCSDGSYMLQVTFENGTDLDMATVKVQNRVSRAEPTLPSAVRQQGVSVTSRSSDIILFVALETDKPETYDGLYLTNYAQLNIVDELSRIEGVGQVEAFGSGERRVAVTGEVYFQVKKDPSRPFYVETDRQVVRVYGTSFNIRAYNDEPATYTTLETGSISLSQSSAPSGELFLSQGHQAILDHTSDRINMSVVDPGVVTSWRHGRFIFENQTLERIMRDLSRWYDFHYEFTDQSLSSRIFMGSIPRYSDFRTAIQVLENCGHIRFTVSPSDNKILISEE